MSILSDAMLFFLALGLAMDAFAVSITNGMCCRIPVAKNALASGLAFGLAQAVMPLVGYAAGHAMSDLIRVVDHWIALLLLGFLGGKMIVEAIRAAKEPDSCPVRPFSCKLLAGQAIATSIDAMAVGISLGMMQVNLRVAIFTIGIITFICCFLGVLIGKQFGRLLRDKAEIFGGAIKIFWEHTHPLFPG